MIVDLLVVLVAAKVAAEVSERVGVPAVLGEIVAGIIVGPSVLGLVHTSEPLAFLAELGVILLLLQVGMETEVRELRAVGRASILVALVGVAVPFALGAVGTAALGKDLTIAVFVGAALTATSVGITARVFGDLRVLATVEARIVLGAAVADDVLGLVILTVVVRLATAGSVSPLDVAGVVVAATAFLVVGGLVSWRAVPPFLRALTTSARSSGVLVAGAVAATLALAAVAEGTGLAPIIGAFLAGLAIAAAPQAERVRRDITPIAHLLVPVFFLHIGLEADVGAFVEPAVLGAAGVLLAAAIAGKLVAAAGAIGSPGDKAMIGIGMLPRGEVGLIFAGIGLAEGVLDRDLYAALLLVVLVTTLATPPLLRWRVVRLQSARREVEPVTPVPEGGWLALVGGSVVLRGSPPPRLALVVGLESAVLVAGGTPSARLLQWFTSLDRHDVDDVEWDESARAQLIAVLHAGNARSWRFLESIGLLERVLPEMADSIERRRLDATELDPAHLFRWVTVESVRGLAATPEHDRLEHPDRLLLAALVLDATGDGEPPVEAARTLAARVGLQPEGADEVAFLVGERGLLRAASLRPDGFEEDRVLTLASHLGSGERARALYLLDLADDDLESWQLERLAELHQRVQRVVERGGIDLGEVGRREAEMLDQRPHVIARLRDAPRPWLITQRPGALASTAAMLDPLPKAGRVRVAVSGARIDVIARDRRGLLAEVAGVLAAAGVEIRGAATATWPDGAVAMSFVVRPIEIDTALLQHRLEARSPTVGASAVPDAHVTFDHQASPWYTIVDVVVADRPGLLASLAAVFTSAGASIHALTAKTNDGIASDRFELTDKRGAKLDGAAAEEIRMALAGTRARTRKPLTRTKQSGDRLETTRP